MRDPDVLRRKTKPFQGSVFGGQDQTLYPTYIPPSGVIPFHGFSMYGKDNIRPKLLKRAMSTDLFSHGLWLPFSHICLKLVQLLMHFRIFGYL